MNWDLLATYVARAVALLTAIPVHESAHAWASDKLGDPTAKRYGRLSLNPLRHFDFLGALCMISVSYTHLYCVREADLSDPDAELSFTPDGKLDVRELAYTELVLEVPTVLLCSDDCAGLCPVCGNRKPCSCRHETSGSVDERLSILKQLLND